MLQHALEGVTTSRPLTHRSMASLIEILDGRLEFVTVDRFVSAGGILEAKLHIDHSNSVRVMDVRISDAVILAVICEVPIFVTSDVLASLPEMQ